MTPTDTLNAPLIAPDVADKIHAERAAMAQAILADAVQWEHAELPLLDGTVALLPVKVGAWPWEVEYGEMPPEAAAEWEIVILPCAVPVPKAVADALRQHPDTVSHETK